MADPTHCPVCDNATFNLHATTTGLWLRCSQCGHTREQLATEEHRVRQREYAQKDLLRELADWFDGIPVDMTEQRLYDFARLRSYTLRIQDEQWTTRPELTKTQQDLQDMYTGWFGPMILFPESSVT